jgi:hypothetical protein
MSGTPTTSKISIVAAGEPTLFDSLPRPVPKDLQTAYYRVLAHTRTLSPDDEMLRILEAMGTLALLTRHTPKDIADERERFQEMFEARGRIILQRLPAQSGNAIARRRQSQMKNMSVRSKFYRTCDVFGQKTHLRLVIALSGYELTFHKLTTHNLYRKEWPPSRCSA